MEPREEHSDVVFSLVGVTHHRGRDVAAWVERVTEQADKLGAPWELIVVVDGPDQEDVAAVREIARRDPSVRMVALAETIGLTRATLAGVEFARGRAVVCVDPVGWTPVSEIPQLAARWREGFAVVAPAQIDGSEEAPPADTDAGSADTVSAWVRRGLEEIRRHLKLAVTRPREDIGLGLMLLDARVVAALRTDTPTAAARRRLLDGPWRVCRVRPVAKEGSGQGSYKSPPVEKAGERSAPDREAWRAVLLGSAGVACIGVLGMVIGLLVWLVSLFRVGPGFVGFLVMTLLGALGSVVALQMREISQLRSQLGDWPRYAVAETEGFEVRRAEDVPTAPPAEAIEQAISIYT